MMKGYTLVGNTIHELSTAELHPKKLFSLGESSQRREVVFVNCYKPDDEELAFFSTLVGRELDVLRELLKAEVRPRIEEENGFFLMVYRAPFYENTDDIITAPITFFIKNNIIFVLSNHKVKSIEQVVKDLEQNKRSAVFRKHVGSFLYYFLDKINDEYLYIMNKIADSSEFIKERGESLSKKSIEKIDSLNTTLIYFNRALLGNAEVVTILKKSHFFVFRKFNRNHFSDLYFDALQLLDTEKIQRDVITSIFNFQNALSSYRLNVFMKRLTSLALLVMIPTFITGVYGMNFTHIPLQNHVYGFYITVAFMILFIVVLFYVFRKWEWI